MNPAGPKARKESSMHVSLFVLLPVGNIESVSPSLKHSFQHSALKLRASGNSDSVRISEFLLPVKMGCQFFELIDFHLSSSRKPESVLISAISSQLWSVIESFTEFVASDLYVLMGEHGKMGGFLSEPRKHWERLTLQGAICINSSKAHFPSNG